MNSNSIKTNQNIQAVPYPSSSLITEDLKVECSKLNLLNKNVKKNEEFDTFYI